MRNCMCFTDVLDLAWAPGDIWLATCSIDNTIIVWNAEKFPGINTVFQIINYN